jgi:hypothetical protein
MARTRREEAGPGSSVEERLIEGARAFVTIGQDAFVWMVLEAQHLPQGLKGAFVRLEPREVSTDEEIARVRRLCEEGGALRITTLPRRRAAAVLAPREKKPHRKAREIVAELVAESNCPDREALSILCEGVMSRRGL